MNKRNQSEMLEARRQFLAKCGKFAVITPPVMTVLLASTAQNYAVAASGNGSTQLQGSSNGNNGFGNGGGDGVPGNSGNTPSSQAPGIAADQVR